MHVCADAVEHRSSVEGGVLPGPSVCGRDSLPLLALLLLLCPMLRSGLLMVVWREPQQAAAVIKR